MLAVIFVATSIVKLSWYLHGDGWPVPAILIRPLGPLTDKAPLDPLRLVSLLCAAYLVGRFLPATGAGYDHVLARPLIACGTNSLHIFCLGVFLAFVAHFVLVELGRSALTLTAVNLVGILTMVGVAYLMSWFKRRSSGRVQPTSRSNRATAAAE
jgi:hypothetical protein